MRRRAGFWPWPPVMHLTKIGLGYGPLYDARRAQTSASRTAAPQIIGAGVLAKEPLKLPHGGCGSRSDQQKHLFSSGISYWGLRGPAAALGHRRTRPKTGQKIPFRASAASSRRKGASRSKQTPRVSRWGALSQRRSDLARKPAKAASLQFTHACDLFPLTPARAHLLPLFQSGGGVGGGGRINTPAKKKTVHTTGRSGSAPPEFPRISCGDCYNMFQKLSAQFG